MDEEEFGIDELRSAVQAFDYCEETFLQQFSAEDLLKIRRVWKKCDWDLFPDQWTNQQTEEAIKDGKVPDFEETEYGMHALNVDDCYCGKCRNK